MVLVLAGAAFLLRAGELRAESAADSVNVNLTVQAGGGGVGGAGGGGGPPGNIGPPAPPPADKTPPANPSNFEAFWNELAAAIDLSWENPADPDFELVRIMRRLDFYPTDPEDGELIYQGKGEEHQDFDVRRGVTYYYTIFARDTSGNWSSGAIARESVPLSEEEREKPPPAEEEERRRDPFAEFPQASVVPEALEQLVFDFFQENRQIGSFRDGSRVAVDASKDLTVSVAYEKLPEVLKTIIVSIQLPGNGRIFSFLLRVDDEKARYSGTIGPLRQPGVYPIQITLLDHLNQKVKRFQGELEVFGVAPLFPALVTPAARKLARIFAPLSSAIGLGAGALQTVLLVFNVKSFGDIYLLFLKLSGALLGFFGGRRRVRPWGTVYDAVTKRPLDPAYVRVLSGGTEVADSITDLDGRYGFFLPQGLYTLQVEKTHYRFPSRVMAGRQKDELYKNLYYGDPILAAEKEVISRDVPLDPVGFDWNEFVKNQRRLFRLWSRRERLKNIVFSGLFGLGFIFSLLAAIITPILFNFAVLAAYLAIFSFQFYWKTRRSLGQVIQSLTREPLPFAIIRLYEPQTNQEVKAVVTDELGRFWGLVAPGRYNIAVEAKQPDGSYRRVWRSGTVELAKGVLNTQISVRSEFEPQPRPWL